MYVVVHDRFVQRLYKPRLDLEALRSRDVLQMDAAKRRCDAYHSLHELIYIFGVYENRHSRDVRQLVVEDGLALHYRHRGHGSYVAEAQDPRAVRADGDGVPDHGQLAGKRGSLGDSLTCSGYPRRVHVTHVLHRPNRAHGLDLELAAFVTQQRPVLCPEDLDALQLVEHLRDSLSVLSIPNLERDLAYRVFAADVDGDYVPDQTFSLGYRTGDTGERAGAVR